MRSRSSCRASSARLSSGCVSTRGVGIVGVYGAPLKEAARAPKIGAHADVAQLVEHHLAKVGVAGSNPVVRSKKAAG